MIWSTLLFPSTSDPFLLALWNCAHWTVVYPSSSTCPSASFLVAELPPNQVHSCRLTIKKGRLYVEWACSSCATVRECSQGDPASSLSVTDRTSPQTLLCLILWVLYLSTFPDSGEQRSEVALLRSYLTPCVPSPHSSALLTLCFPGPQISGLTLFCFVFSKVIFVIKHLTN